MVLLATERIGLEIVSPTGSLKNRESVLTLPDQVDIGFYPRPLVVRVDHRVDASEIASHDALLNWNRAIGVDYIVGRRKASDQQAQVKIEEKKRPLYTCISFRLESVKQCA